MASEPKYKIDDSSPEHAKIEGATHRGPRGSEEPSARANGSIGNGPERTARLPGSTHYEPAQAALARQPTPIEEIETFFELALTELSALRTAAAVDSIKRAVELIFECEDGGGRVHVTGVGKSEYVARYVASLMSSTGTPAYFLHATECVHGSAGQLCNSDVAIAISNSGTTPELMSAVEVLRELKIRIIGVSGTDESPLASASDVFLYAGVANEGGLLNLAPRASILAETYVLCALSVALEACKGLTREQYARWHPGGVLGRLARGD